MKSRRHPRASQPGGTGATALRIGVLGCSDIARRKFIPALLWSRAAVMTAISSRSLAKADRFAGGGDTVAMSHEALLGDPAVDLVYLSLPNHLHEEWAVRALRAGKHVICEKPLGLSAAAVERMTAAAAEHGRLLYENLMFLHHPQHAAVREIVASGSIGRVKSLRAVFGFPVPKRDDFRLDPLQGGGACHDLARYPLGTALYFLAGIPAGFRGHAICRAGLNLAVQGTAVTSADELFFFSMAFGQQYESFYELVGETGRIRLDRAYTTPPDYENRIKLLQGEVENVIIVPPCDHFQTMIEAVAGIIRYRTDFEEYHERSRLLARLAQQLEEGCRG